MIKLCDLQYFYVYKLKSTYYKEPWFMFSRIDISRFGYNFIEDDTFISDVKDLK
jgi:hypothetical protein